MGLHEAYARSCWTCVHEIELQSRLGEDEK